MINFDTNNEEFPNEEFPNAEDSIVIETANSFKAAVETRPDGTRKFFTLQEPTRKEVVDRFYWNERKILEGEIHSGKLSPALPPKQPLDAEDEDFEIDDDLSYRNATINPAGDQWEKIIGKTPTWNDIDEDTVKND